MKCYECDKPRTIPILTGAEVCAMMRRHRITIRELAMRMDITLKRVRHVRRYGITSGVVARDWCEGIWGRDPGPVT